MAVTAPIFVFLLLAAPRFYAQQSATLQGHVLNTSEGTVAGATITLRSRSVDFDASVHTDSEGRYVITDIPAGTYTLEAVAAGLRPEVIEVLVLDVGRSVVRDFRLQIGEWSDAVIVSAEIPLITRTRFSTGEAGSSRQIQLALKAWF